MRKKSRALLPVSLMVTGALITGASYYSLNTEQAPEATATEVVTTQPAPEPAPGVTVDPFDYEQTVSVEPFEVEAQEADEEDPLRAYPELKDRFVMPRLGIDAGLKTFTPERCTRGERERAAAEGRDCEPNSYYPPTYDEAWIGQRADGTYGTPTDPNLSTYVYLHSAWGMDAVGNPMTDVINQRTLVEVGDIFIVDGVEYQVTETREVLKDELEKPHDDPTKADNTQGIYIRERGRLVIFTCLQNPDGSYALTNVVTIAHRTAAQDNPAEVFA